MAVILLALASHAWAQEWHESYRSGVAALARGDNARAAEALRRAIALHPEPGRSVLTYGTNVEPRYYPYLHLAEAYLRLGQLEAAKETLEKSASWGNREPASDREKLVARLDGALSPARAAPTAPPAPSTPSQAPSSLPTATPTVEASSGAPAPVPSTLASAPSAAAPSLQPRPSPPESSQRLPPPDGKPSAPVPGSLGVTETTGTLEILSQPAGSTAYIDDEAVGVTDPQSGRLVKTGLRAGRHRVRVSHAGYEEAVRDIDVARGGSASLRVSLAPVPSVSAPVPGWLVAIALLALGALVVLAWLALRRPAKRPAQRESALNPRTSDPYALTPAASSNPGVRSDELGQEWFGDFRLLEMLGKGGMASVFKAQRRDEMCALKRPLAALLDDPQFRERFLREAEIGRTLNHPNIVRILERGKVGDVPYFTMELLAGETLQDFIRVRGAAGPRGAVSTLVQVAEAVDFAHGKGVVHRDLKPSNVMLLPDGTAKVMDFGIARARRFEGITATAAFLGTPDYVAPEMIEGHGTEPRSDLYGLGLILFELLTGQRPFSGETPFAILKKHSTEEPPPPSRIRPGVPAALDAIVLQLLRKDPQERPSSAEELVVALRDWLNRAA
jgi:hypothetical protein